MKKRYRLGNQPTEYELITDFLRYNPLENTWDEIFDPLLINNYKDMVITLSLDSHSVKIILHQQIIKDAFPMSVYSEERFDDWNTFCIVSYVSDPDALFIIPIIHNL